MEIIIILLAVLVIAISIFNIYLCAKKKKKKSAIFNSVFYGMIVLLFGFHCVDNAFLSEDSGNYDIYGGDMFHSFTYDREEGDNYIIAERAFIHGSSIAVPKENTSISAFTRIYKPVYLYCDKGTYFINGDDVVKIRPDFLPLIFVAGAIDIVALALYNLVLFIINAVCLCKKSKAK